MTMTRTVSAVLVAALATTAAPALAQSGNYDGGYDPRYEGVDYDAPLQADAEVAQDYFDYSRAREDRNARLNGAGNVADDGHAYVIREDLGDYRGQDPRGYEAPVQYAAPVAPAAPAYRQAPAGYGAPQYGAPAQHAAPQYGAGAGQYGIATGRISPHLAYTMEQREAWLGDCRRLYEQEDNHSERRGLIGSLLGALVGGVAGNRIAGVGDRLGGSLIGAGVGGLAGAVIGGLFGGGGRDRDDDRDYREIDECESYLLRYERSAQTNPGGQYGAGYGQQNVQWIRVPIQTTRNNCNSCREVVVEEWVEEEVAPRRQTRRVVRKAAPVQKKTKRIKYVK